MGLILLALIGFLPTYYALDLHHDRGARSVHEATLNIRAELDREQELTPPLAADLDTIAADLEGKTTFFEVKPADRWKVRSTIYRFRQNLDQAHLSPATLTAIAPYRAGVFGIDRVRALLGHGGGGAGARSRDDDRIQADRRHCRRKDRQRRI